MSSGIDFRDSWNEWRRKVNQALGGGTEPVPASNVSYNGTSAGLTANNVQTGIDEVAGMVGAVDDKVDAVNNVLDEKYIYTVIQKQYSVITDGVKTLGEMLKSVYLEAFNSLQTGEYLIAKNGGMTGSYGFQFISYAQSSAGEVFGQRIYMDSNGASLYTLQLSDTNCKLYTMAITSSTFNAPVERSTDVPVANKTVYINVDIYKKLDLA